MRLLHHDGAGRISLAYFPNYTTPPPYAILSHTWGDEEVTFADVQNGFGEKKVGYNKIRFCGEQASRDGLQYYWVDTCCIDKSSATELQESLIRMFAWYRCAVKCYVFMSDVTTADANSSYLNTDHKAVNSWDSAFRGSKWFTRGWTLQELIAPAHLDFFSVEGRRLGDRKELEQQVHEVTKIPVNALRGNPMSGFSVAERMGWVGKRETTVEEDKAYSLFGIFNIQMPLLYGEGRDNAFKRLHAELDKASKPLQENHSHCLADLRPTDPRDDKTRIEQTKGGLLRDSYIWIFDNDDFKEWRSNSGQRLLWIKGDPGKGKTMLMCGIIDELQGRASSPLLSYFFCQATDARINNATSVLRGLMYLLVVQKPSLTSYLQTNYDEAGGKTLFEGVNAWSALTTIFINMLEDSNLPSTYFVVDALDECTTDLPLLLDLIARKSTAYAHVKWIVSSRNWPNIQEQLAIPSQKLWLSLELNRESISGAVTAYIQRKVGELVTLKKYDDSMRSAVYSHLVTHANDTFLWVSLVCQDLAKTNRWKTISRLTTLPPGLNQLYEQMMGQVCDSEDAELCRHILAIASTVYRPVTLDELAALIDMSDAISDIADIVGLCGSFLTLGQRTVFFVHQSAKDFVLKSGNVVFPSGINEIHHSIFAQSLQIMSSALRRDIYGLCHPGTSIDEVQTPTPDPLASAWYSCIFWLDHVYDCITSEGPGTKFDDMNAIDKFLRTHYLHWLEALGLIGAMSDGILSMLKLEALHQDSSSEPSRFVQDACRFIRYHKHVIEISPLQVYVSALMFSPKRSVVRQQFQMEEPEWMTTKPVMDDFWSPCLQTLEGHSQSVFSVDWSANGKWLASASLDSTVKIWNPLTGQCKVTFEGHNRPVYSVAWKPGSDCIASASEDGTVKVWNASTGQCQNNLKGHRNEVNSVAWSADGRWLASASDDCTVKIWDPATGECKTTLDERRSAVRSVAWSGSSGLLASSYADGTIMIWVAVAGRCQVQATLRGHVRNVYSLVWSADERWLASASLDRTVKIWNLATGKCRTTLSGHTGLVSSIAWSGSTGLLASAAQNGIEIWDPATGQYRSTLKGHGERIYSVAWSPDGKRLATASSDNTAKIWDPALDQGDSDTSLQSHSSEVRSVRWSVGTQLVSASRDGAYKVWDPVTGLCKATFEADGLAANDPQRDREIDSWLTRRFDLYDSDEQIVPGFMDLFDLDDASDGPDGPDGPDGSDGSDGQGSFRTQTLKYNLEWGENWVTCNRRELLWLPSEYRPTCVAVLGANLASGCSSGRVLIFRFGGHLPFLD